MKDTSKNNTKKLSLEELELLIERYFEGETSEEEELRLRVELCDCTYCSRLIDECLVTMGYFSVGKRVEREKRTRGKVKVLRRVASVAAMTAIVLVLGLTLLKPDNDAFGEGDCVAYVNGVEVNDHEEVLALVKSSLNDMSMTTEIEPICMETQFSMIREIMLENNKE